MCIGPTLQAVGRGQQHRRDADREQDHRKRPDHVHRPREHRVGRAAVEPCDQREHGGDDRADDGRPDADQQRVASAVQDPRGHVAARAVGTEEVVVRDPTWDRSASRRARAYRRPCWISGTCLAVDDRRAVEVVRRTGRRARCGARTTAPQRLTSTIRTNTTSAADRRLVSAETPPRERPGTAPGDLRRGSVGIDSRPAVPTRLRHEISAYHRGGAPARDERPAPWWKRPFRLLVQPDLVVEHVPLRAPLVALHPLGQEVDLLRVVEVDPRQPGRSRRGRPAPRSCSHPPGR